MRTSIKVTALVGISFVYLCQFNLTTAQVNYLNYHQKITKCEKFISEKKYNEAIYQYNLLFSEFDFIFLRDYKVLAQLYGLKQEEKECMKYIRLGILSGWKWKNIRKVKLFDFMHSGSAWKSIRKDYDSLHSNYLKSLNKPLKDAVHKLFKKDQQMAIKYLFKFGQKAKIKYAESKFASHSKEQLAQLNKMFTEFGYPGEMLIGNDWWVSVILSHHNSISVSYNSKDAIYDTLRPKIVKALKKGQLAPYTFAIFEDWRVATLSDHGKTKYGLLGSIPNIDFVKKVNSNRQQIGMRTVELRNKLIDIEKETKLNLHLPKDWVSGKITVLN